MNIKCPLKKAVYITGPNKSAANISEAFVLMAEALNITRDQLRDVQYELKELKRQLRVKRAILPHELPAWYDEW